MFKRKDIVRSMFLLLLMFTIMMTLSQILVVHQHKHHDGKQRDVTRLRNMLRELERNIDLMLKKDALPLDKYERTLQAMIYSNRVATIIVERGWSEVDFSGKFYGRKFVNDGQYDPKSERKSRVLQNIDITYPSKKSKRTMKKSFRKLPSIPNTQNKKASVMNMKQIGLTNSKKLRTDADIDKESNSDVLASDPRSASVRQDLKLDIGKGTSRFSNKGKLLKKEYKLAGNKCPNVPEGLGKHHGYN